MSVQTLSLGSIHKARVWIGELPDAKYAISEILEVVQQAQPLSDPSVRYVAIEVMIVTGPRVQNGLLGASFTPSQSDKLAIQVALSDDTEQPDWRFPQFNRTDTNWTLATKGDSIYLGILKEYANGVLDGARDAGQLLGAGLLRFDCAAHGLVGSSWRIFQGLAEMVVRILSHKEVSLTEEELRTMISSTFGLSQQTPPGA